MIRWLVCVFNHIRPKRSGKKLHYIFSGRVRPDGVAVNFDVKDPLLKLTVSGVEGQTCQISVLLSGGIHIALAVTTAAPIRDVFTFRNQMTTVCKSIYDAASFLHGRYVSVELTSLTEIETDHFWTFRDEVPELQNTSGERPVPVEELTKLAVANVYLRSSLSDLSSAIVSPNDTGFYCYRAIEALMQEFKQSGETDKQEGMASFSKRLASDAALDKATNRPLGVEPPRRVKRIVRPGAGLPAAARLDAGLSLCVCAVTRSGGVAVVRISHAGQLAEHFPEIVLRAKSL
jgi:hypothetical protein